MKYGQIPAEKFVEAREWFATHGVSISDWAAEKNVNKDVLYAVLRGKSRCLRGESHRIAVLLGLKPSFAAATLVDAPVLSSQIHTDSLEVVRESRLSESSAVRGAIPTPLHG